MFPDPVDYLTMRNKAARMDDIDLIDYLTGRIAKILSRAPAPKSQMTSTA
jgi:hypothetical protein